jgi:hypothetical protein
VGYLSDPTTVTGSSPVQTSFLSYLRTSPRTEYARSWLDLTDDRVSLVTVERETTPLDVARSESAESYRESVSRDLVKILADVPSPGTSDHIRQFRAVHWHKSLTAEKPIEAKMVGSTSVRRTTQRYVSAQPMTVTNMTSQESDCSSFYSTVLDEIHSPATASQVEPGPIFWDGDDPVPADTNQFHREWHRINGIPWEEPAPKPIIEIPDVIIPPPGVDLDDLYDGHYGHDRQDGQFDDRIEIENSGSMPAEDTNAFTRQWLETTDSPWPKQDQTHRSIHDFESRNDLVSDAGEGSSSGYSSPYGDAIPEPDFPLQQTDESNEELFNFRTISGLPSYPLPRDLSRDGFDECYRRDSGYAALSAGSHVAEGSIVPKFSSGTRTIGLPTYPFQQDQASGDGPDELLYSESGYASSSCYSHAADLPVIRDFSQQAVLVDAKTCEEYEGYGALIGEIPDDFAEPDEPMMSVYADEDIHPDDIFHTRPNLLPVKVILERMTAAAEASQEPETNYREVAKSVFPLQSGRCQVHDNGPVSPSQIASHHSATVVKNQSIAIPPRFQRAHHAGQAVPVPRQELAAHDMISAQAQTGMRRMAEIGVTPADKRLDPQHDKFQRLYGNLWENPGLECRREEPWWRESVRELMACR